MNVYVTSKRFGPVDAFLDIVQEVYDMCMIGNSSSQKSIKQETVDKSGVCNILNEKRRLFQTNY